MVDTSRSDASQPERETPEEDVSRGKNDEANEDNRRRDELENPAHLTPLQAVRKPPSLVKANSMPRLDLALSPVVDLCSNISVPASLGQTPVISEQLKHLQLGQANATNQMATLMTRQEELSSQLAGVITLLKLTRTEGATGEAQPTTK